MTIRQEIQDMVLEAARLALEQTAGPLQKEDRERLLANFEGRVQQYAGRYPVLDLLNEMQAAADAARTAATATSRHIRSESVPQPGEDKDRQWPPTPITDIWVQAIRQSAQTAKERHFRKAKSYFTDGRDLEATKELCKAITCQVAAIASQRGWPHQSEEDIDDVITALSTGTLPEEDADVYELLRSASEQGQDLNSAFAAAMGQPNAVGNSLFYDSGKGYNEDAMLFAERTIELAKQLAREPR